MTPSVRRWFGITFALYGAAIVQCVYAEKMQVYGAIPDFLTAAAVLIALFGDPNRGAAVGFFAGLILAVLASPPHGGFGSLILSRTLVCFAVGLLEHRIFRDHALIALVLVGGGTLAAETLLFVFAPQHNITHWARGMASTTIYNTVLAVPLYFLIRWIVRPNAEGEDR